jgi:hypothetical protein
MSLFLPYPRGTLLIPSGPSHNPSQRHLFVILTNPSAQPDEEKLVALAGITSIRANVYYDPACLLFPGDHPFIVQDSYVLYSHARLEDAEALLRGVRDGRLIPHRPIDEPVFARICSGLMTSRHVP